MKTCIVYFASACIVMIGGHAIVGGDAAQASETHARLDSTVVMSEHTARSINHIPASVKYLKGSSVLVTEGIRCFSAKPKRSVHVQGIRVSKKELVGYCSDGYVDASTADGLRVINPHTSW